jgi:hypothetical protein
MRIGKLIGATTLVTVSACAITCSSSVNGVTSAGGTGSGGAAGATTASGKSSSGSSSSAPSSSSSGGGSATGGDCFDYTTFDGSSPAVSFKNDVLPIWRTSCGLSMSCHGNPIPPAPAQHYYGPANSDPAPTTADIAMILAGTVGVASIDEPDMPVIKASDPAHSFMMYKLDGDPTNLLSGVDCTNLQCAVAQPNVCLLAMPQGGAQLPEAERNTIRSWIAQGAENN